MTRPNSPWIDRFRIFESSDEDLDRLIAIPAPAPPCLEALSVQQAVSQLGLFWKGVVVPSAQMRNGIRAMADLARAYAVSRYPDERSFLQAAYRRNQSVSESEMPALCLTGLAGAGKSQIVAAFHRVLGPARATNIEGHSNVPLAGAWRVSAMGAYGVARLLSEHFRPSATGSPKFDVAVREARAQGVCLQTVDELQFITQSNASAHAAKILLQLLRVGPPVVFVSNYSMLHLLNKRSHQERDRLLANLLVIEPDGADSEDWSRLVRELLASLPQFSQLLRERGIEEVLHSYTFGLKRALGALLCTAYAITRRSTRPRKVALDDLEVAYMSLDYATYRSSVSMLIAGQANHAKLTNDLFCPLAASAASGNRATNVAIHPAAASFHKREAQEAVRSMLNDNERAGLQAATGKPDRPSRRRTSVSVMPRPALSSDALIEGANHFGLPPERSV